MLLVILYQLYDDILHYQLFLFYIIFFILYFFLFFKYLK